MRRLMPFTPSWIIIAPPNCVANVGTPEIIASRTVKPKASNKAGWTKIPLRSAIRVDFTRFSLDRRTPSQRIILGRGDFRQWFAEFDDFAAFVADSSNAQLPATRIKLHCSLQSLAVLPKHFAKPVKFLIRSRRHWKWVADRGDPVSKIWPGSSWWTAFLLPECRSQPARYARGRILIHSGGTTLNLGLTAQFHWLRGTVPASWNICKTWVPVLYHLVFQQSPGGADNKISCIHRVTGAVNRKEIDIYPPDLKRLLNRYFDFSRRGNIALSPSSDVLAESYQITIRIVTTIKSGLLWNSGTAVLFHQ